MLIVRPTLRRQSCEIAGKQTVVVPRYSAESLKLRLALTMYAINRRAIHARFGAMPPAWAFPVQIAWHSPSNAEFRHPRGKKAAQRRRRTRGELRADAIEKQSA